MSLKWYRMPRMVVLKPSNSVLEAARAIEKNNIGAVIVQDDKRVVGMVTDRDLAVRVLGKGLDANATKLAEVMTSPIVTLSPTDNQSDAIRLMQQRNIRRIPLVEAERIVGIVTLDDLLLDEAAPLEQLAAIVEAQIGDGGPAPLRSPWHDEALHERKRLMGVCLTPCGIMPSWKRPNGRRWRSKSLSARS